MVHHQGKLKSRSLARVQVKTTKGNSTHYKRRNRQMTKCAVTKKALRGLPRFTDYKYGNLNRTKKTISRPFGGYMSHIALKEKILNEVVLKEEENL